MSKKILLIIGILVIVGLAAFLIFSSKPQTGEEGDRVGFSIRDYLPFGRSENSGTDNNIIIERESPNGNDTSKTPPNPTIPRLRKISSEPVSGAVIFDTGSTSVVRFVEKGTGNVYEAKSNSTLIERLTNTTIPKIIRSFWLPNGSGFLAQTLMEDSEIIETSFVKLNKTVGSSTTETLTPFSTTKSKLPTDIKEITIKPDGTKIFYYVAPGDSNWFISNPDGTNNSLVFSHPLTEWMPKWIGGDIVMMQTKGSAGSAGYTYSFDVKNKVLNKAGVSLTGLSSTPKSDGTLALSSNGGAAPHLFLVDNKNFSSKPISIATLAEKCVWLKDKNPTAYCAIPNQLPSGSFPDVWYKGIVSTEDFIEKIEINSDIFYKIADLSELSGQKIDVVDMSISPNETHIIFRNKIDGFLWMLRVTE